MAERPGKLESQLIDTRSIPDSMKEVFKILELEDGCFDSAMHLPKSLLNMDESIAAVIFLSRYIIAIVRDFSRSPIDYDLILAAYGFLEGYEYPTVHKRHLQYCQDVGIHKKGKDIPLNMHWKKENIDRSLNSKEDSAIKKLANRLEIELAKKGGILGYAAEAEKLIGIPFPSPNYLLGNGYRECESNGKVFYVPLTNEELRSLANMSAPKATSVTPGIGTNDDILSEDGVKANEPEGNQTEIENKIKSESEALGSSPPEEMDIQTAQSLEGQGDPDEETALQENGKKPEDFPPQPEDIEPLVPIPSTTMWEKIKRKIDGYLNKSVKRKEIIGASIFILMAVASMSAVQSFKNTKHSQPPTETASNANVTENETLTITGITIYNADITLAPDKTWEHLQVGIYPREANIEDVNYYSDNVRLVTVNRSEEIVELASGWSGETKRSTEVHVQFEEVDAKALVTVQENPIADSTAAHGESSLEGNDSANTERVSGF